MRIKATSGFLASSLSEAKRCGSNVCPWLLVAPKGQRLNISLYDFAWSVEGKKMLVWLCCPLFLRQPSTFY